MNQNVLSVQVTPSKLAKEFGLSEDEVIKIIRSARQKLREYRDKNRVRPDLDDKIIVAVNGLAIGALAKSSILLDGIDAQKAAVCREAATKAVSFIKRNLFFAGDRVTAVIDFDLCNLAPRLYDLCLSLQPVAFP